MDNIRIIKETISRKKERKDKNSRDYLILELDNKETLFVFPLKVNEERWNWLEEGKSYNFTVEESKKGGNLLVDFEIEINA
ncbi:MAG: hypothetical protein mread185_000557 [Mycoplasmataceae bacterium]|nr:MAG: hypothetical protein mread185_000557 [Mycoplasmataceae bacterium]